MSQTTLRNQKSIKVLRNDEEPNIRHRSVTSEPATSLPQGYVRMPMVVLEQPEPIRRKSKRKR